jgi:S1-C subfamily serine protease
MHVWRKRALYIVLCGITVLFGWLATRLWNTYLPVYADKPASFHGYLREGQTFETVQRAAGDLPQLEEQVRRTAQAVLPTVVAIRNPVKKPSDVGRHQTNYASGVIITTDGIVLSQWHVSHWKVSEDGDGSMIRDSSPSCTAGDRTTVIFHDGRECPAELLGANRTHDVSLLRLLEPGPYPHVPIGATAPVIECAVPFYSYECGGPIVDLTGRTIGVTIARYCSHGGMVIPGDRVLELLPDLQAGRLAGNWAPGCSPGK